MWNKPLSPLSWGTTPWKFPIWSSPSLHAIFWEYSLCFPDVAMFETSSEHLGNILNEKIFLKVLVGKVVFVLKVYDLIITNVDLLANFTNHEVVFPEYSKNISRMSVSKIFQGYPRNIVKLWKYFQNSKSSKNCFVGYPVKILKLAVSSLAMFFELYWNHFTFRVMFWKCSHRSLTAGKNFKKAQHCYNHYKSFPSGI